MIRMFTRHVRRVGQLHADVALVRAERSHRERHHVHRASPHRALGRGPWSVFAHLLRVSPVVRRAGSCSVAEQMKVRSSTRATSPGVGEREVGVGSLGIGQPLEGAPIDETPRRGGDTPPPIRRTTGSSDGLGQCGDLLDPGKQALVLRWCGGGRVHRVLAAPWSSGRVRCRRSVPAPHPGPDLPGNVKTPCSGVRKSYRTVRESKVPRPNQRFDRRKSASRRPIGLSSGPIRLSSGPWPLQRPDPPLQRPDPLLSARSTLPPA